ncbi:MAG: hypothetical protein DSZ00_10645 [Gammaproteobacteria bacterium]|nr:MAG: hypothetical protein DSZ00_10645 [Gammaproteobacteria bacterium]RTZ74953.1 MAG: hypothetical protein DSZ02_04340 [Gammaproteobacteria bacterium]
MVRKLAMAVSLAVGTLPLSVYALGLGEIKTSSALNEKFEAEIELLSVKKGELDSLRVGLAPAEVFAQTGVERPFLLSRLKFKPIRTRDGKAVIRITSDVPIREPFLDFFVQVAWPKGQLVREYTVLLDPPVVTKRRAPKVTAPAAAAAPRRTEPVEPGAPAAESRYAAATPGGEYGPVQSNETLWKIADRLRPAGISIHQMMVALYKANPSAFLNNDINLLKKGQVLRIPEENEIRSIGRKEAVAEFGRLSEGWIAKTETGSATPEEAGPTEEEAAAAPQTAVAETEPAAEEARLKIAGAEDKVVSEPGTGESAGAQDADREALRQKLLLVEEEAATARQEAENLRQRMDSMESKLEEMSRLLKLKDEELAQLQAQTAAGSVAAESAVTQQATTPSATEETTETAEPAPESTVEKEVVEEVAEEAAPEEPGVSEETTPAGETETGEAVVSTVTEEPAPAVVEEETRVETIEAAPATTAEAEAPGPKLIEEPKSGGEQWTQWLTDNWKLVAGGGGAVLLGLIGLAFSRRRKETETQEIPPSATAPRAETRETESILEEEDAAALQQAADSAIGDTSFLSEYSTEELRALNEDTVDVDPVSEADVYIAYGRYSQAEEILREAMENGDESAAVRHKMLEVYYATQKKDEFEKLVEEMKAAGQDKEDPKAWEHILTMGRDLDRNNPLFAAAAAAGALKSEPAPDTEPESELSLDLSTLAEEVDSALNPESEPVDSFSNLDLELPSLQIEPGEHKEAKATETEMSKEPSGMDLEFNETELHTELADINDLGELGIESNMLDETLADLADDLEGVMADSQVLDEPIDLEESGISALESLTGTIPAEELSDEEAPSQTISNEDSQIGDEVETKLELAKAFMEIGDADGARSILHEVQEDGTPSQKEAAGELLSQLEG